MADDATNYLQNEFSKAQRNFRAGLIIMGVLAVFMIGYFQWLKSQTQELLEPTNISEFVVNETRRNLPHAAEALTSTIQESAPSVVRFVMHQVIELVFPMLREGFRSGFQEYSSALITIGRDTTTVAFQDALRAAQEEVAKSRATTPAAIATVATAAMTSRLPAQLDAASEANLGSKAAESAGMLADINKRLKDIAGKPKTREEALAKRLITTWWSFLQQNKQDVGELAEGALKLPGGKLLDISDVTEQGGAAPGKDKKAAK